MPLLGQVWRVREIEDAEKFVSKVLDDSLRKRNAFLRSHEREDAIAYLLSVVWELGERWDPERAPSFATYAYRTLRLRVVDFYRQEYGRTRWSWSDTAKINPGYVGTVQERERPAVLSLDAHDSAGGSRLDELVGTRGGDSEDDCDPDLERVLAGGSRQVARDLDVLGIAPPRGIAA